MRVQLEDVSKVYRAGPSALRALDQVSLAVDAGEFVVITGRSGSGKTTLLNLIGGMTRPSAGRIELGGRDLAAMTDSALSRLRGESIGMVFQFAGLLPTLTALENVLLPSLFHRPAEPSRAQDLLAAVGLADRSRAYPRELSAGQQRRLGVARALLNRPQLLLCDEPTSDLDLETEKAIMALIQQAHRAGAAVILTTHNPDLAAYATRTLGLRAGRIE
jgi:heme ABC exporter ATP-binding subunit CcmA